jgi:hypothetical protein
LDHYYSQHLQLDIVVYGIHVFGMFCFSATDLLAEEFDILCDGWLAGFNMRIYGMDLSYDALYRMFLISEIEIPKSNVALSLIEGIIYEIINLKVYLSLMFLSL